MTNPKILPCVLKPKQAYISRKTLAENTPTHTYCCCLFRSVPVTVRQEKPQPYRRSLSAADVATPTGARLFDGGGGVCSLHADILEKPLSPLNETPQHSDGNLLVVVAL